MASGERADRRELGRVQRGNDGQHPGARAPAHSLPPEVWGEWTKPYPKFWRGKGPTRRLAFAPLCMHQYSQTWIDFRGIRDAPMRAAGFDYFENSRRETYANRAWCIANPDAVGRIFKGRVGPQRLRRAGHVLSAHSRDANALFFGYAARGPKASRTGATTAPSPRPPRLGRCLSLPRS